MTGVDVVAATRDEQCATCGILMLKGSRIVTDGARGWHTTCPVPVRPGDSLAAGAASGSLAGDLARTRGTPSDHYVQIAAWVPIERVERVIAAIRDARGW
jgi:hypothetical protein